MVTKYRVIAVSLGSAFIATCFASILFIIQSRTWKDALKIAVENHVSMTTYLMYTKETLIFVKVWLSIYMLIAVIMFCLCVPVIQAILIQIRTNNNKKCSSYKGTIMLFSVLAYITLSYIPMVLMYFVPKFLSLPL